MRDCVASASCNQRVDTFRMSEALGMRYLSFLSSIVLDLEDELESEY